MNTPRLLIVFASRFGQTEKIAKRIATVAGVRTDVVAVADAQTISLQDYDFLIIASPVYFGKHDRKLEEFVRRNALLIIGMQSAFVSVSGSKDETLVHEFTRRTGWIPEIHVSFAGAEPYTKYGLFTRWIMRSIARKHGRHVDVHRDYDFTDWDAVERFALDFIGYATTKKSA
jgi:menaquinone-dependent protoporphyrinogen oxidase